MRHVILAIGQENAFPWIERDIGIEFDENGMPVVDQTTFAHEPGVFFGGDAAWGPENIIWAVEHGHQAAISIHNHCQGMSAHRAAGVRDESRQLEGGHACVELQQRLQLRAAHEDAARGADEALQERRRRGGARVHAPSRRRRKSALPQLRHRDGLHGEAVHRVRRLHRRLPGELSHDHARDGDERRLRTHLSAPATNLTQEIYVSAPLPQTKRIMVKDEDVCLHCGLCAERCPTAAWDMSKFDLLCHMPGDACAG